MAKYNITRFKSLKVALKELEPFFRNVAVGKQRAILENGRPIKRFGNMLPHEFLANWLLAAVGNFIVGADEFEFTSDPLGGDGLIYHAESQTALQTEHVMVRGPMADAQTGIIQAVAEKIAKGGAAYAGGKTLLVFLYGGDGARWFPDKVAVALPRPLHFDHVWVVTFQCEAAGDRIYALTRLDRRFGHAPVWWVRIHASFESWEVSERPPPNLKWNASMTTIRSVTRQATEMPRTISRRRAPRAVTGSISPAQP